MKKTFLFTAVAALGITLANLVFAQESLIKDYEATNCTYTGNTSDYCYASTGSQNVKVLACRPGSTDCGYSLP